MNRNYIAGLIELHEGCRASVYKDTTGNLTVGIGLNLDAPGGKGLIQSFGIDYNALCSGNLALSEDQIQSLFEHSLNQAIAGAQTVIPAFDTLPDKVQGVCVDLAFNMGTAKLLKFHKFIAALIIGDYTQAAAELKDSLWCTQVGSRCADNCSILESA